MSPKKTSLYAVTAAATLSLALTACGGSNGSASAGGTWDKDATVNIGSLYEPQNLDNTAGGGQGVTEALNGNVYEGLFRLTDDGDVEKLLASDYKVGDDGLTYTFTLRDGVKFHSGKDLTSADVKYSLEKVLADDSQSARKSNLEVVKDIATPDKRTVKITLSNPAEIPHNVSLRGNGVNEQGETVGKGGTSEVSAKLEPGTYQFFCSVPGHEQAGMLGTLTVK